MTNLGPARTAIAVMLFTAAAIIAIFGTLGALNPAPAAVGILHTAVQGCWFEKVATLDTAEKICGPTDLRPAVDTADIVQVRDGELPDAVWTWTLAHGGLSSPTDGCECLYVPAGTPLGPDGHQWAATADGVEPVGAN